MAVILLVILLSIISNVLLCDKKLDLAGSRYGVGSAGMYPAIPVMTRSYETSKVMQVGGAEGGNPTPQPRSSLGSSPKSSPSPCDSPPDQRHHASLAVGAGAGVDNQSDKSAEFGEFGSASSV